VTYLGRITELCRQHRLPAVFDAREYVEAGGLLSYGPNIDAIYRQLATYVGKLLRGAPPPRSVSRSPRASSSAPTP
jgi:putative ABC transport system substrate-binding protein